MNLSDKMLSDIMTALLKGEVYDYKDENQEIHISPNGVSIKYSSHKPEVKQEINLKEQQEKEVSEFLTFVDQLDDDLFVETCEAFRPGVLEQLQKDLDTPRYKHTIEVFKNKAREVGENKLTEFCNAADAEIRHQEEVIKNASLAIEDVHKQLEKAQRKYYVKF